MRQYVPGLSRDAWCGRLVTDEAGPAGAARWLSLSQCAGTHGQWENADQSSKRHTVQAEGLAQLTRSAGAVSVGQFGEQPAPDIICIRYSTDWRSPSSR